MTLKEAILGYINRSIVMDQTVLMDALEISMLEYSQANQLQAISELVMSGDIKRIEYTVKDRSDIRSFYMIGESKLRNV